MLLLRQIKWHKQALTIGSLSVALRTCHPQGRLVSSQGRGTANAEPKHAGYSLFVPGRRGLVHLQNIAGPSSIVKR